MHKYKKLKNSILSFLCVGAMLITAFAFYSFGGGTTASADTDTPTANEAVLSEGHDSEGSFVSGEACGVEAHVTAYFGPTETKNYEGTEVTIGEGVTEISEGEFANCTDFEKIVLPSSLTHIGYGAFYGCTSLEEIEFSSANNVELIDAYAFYGCTSLGEVEVGDGAVVGEYAFAACDGLESVEIGANVVIGDYAFFGTLAPDYDTWYEEYGTSEDGEYSEKYLDVYEYDDEDEVYVYDFDEAYGGALDSVEFGAGCEIGSFAFANNVSLSSLDLDVLDDSSDESDKITIGDHAFYNCMALDEDFFENVSRIGAFAFSVKHEVTNLVVSDGGEGSFGFAYEESDEGTAEYVCSKYWGGFTTELSLESVTRLDEGAFAYNNKIDSISLGPDLNRVGAGAFYECESLEEADGLDGIEDIGAYAFAGTVLKDVSLMSGASVGEGAFSDCEALKSADLSGVSYIGAYAFSKTALDSVVDVSGAKYIGDYAFADIESNDVIEVVLLDSDGRGNLAETGENPFRLTDVAFVRAETEEGKEVPFGESFFVTDGVFVSDGVLYVTGTEGLVLVSYPLGKRDLTCTVEDGTVRIGADAFRGNAYLRNVIMPRGLSSIGDAAFYGCDALAVVAFTGYAAPAAEGEVFEDVTDAVMVAPANGKGYDAYAQAFGTVVYGEAAASPDTLAVIKMIEALPEPDEVTLSDSEEIYEALAAYNALTEDEKPLVTNAYKLFDDWTRLQSLEGARQEEGESSSSFMKDNMWGLIIALIILLAFVALLIYTLHVRRRLFVALEANDISEAAGEVETKEAVNEDAASENAGTGETPKGETSEDRNAS